jgi:hypothetical protein
MTDIKVDGRKHMDVLVWPHVDLDAVYTWDGDNLSHVEITGLGMVKTIVYSYDGGGKLIGKSVVIVPV